ncbi:hypothetical protein BDR03DRAFT_1017804 [Suillus americanus]|nr:hypothetical protein BDR03DRAFT_1017804 [Suillus americanus]
MWAGRLGLWPYISGDEKEPSPPTLLTDPDQNILRKEKHYERVRLYKQCRLLALSALSTAIDAQDFVYLCDTEDLNVGWDALAGKYLPQKAIQFNQYLDRLFTIPKAHNSSLIAGMLQNLVVLSAAATTTTPPTPNEYKVPDAIFVHILLRALPDYYDPFHQTLINSNTALNFNDIVNHLKTQELHCTTNGGNTKHAAMFSGHQCTVNSPSKADRIPPKGFDESKGDGWDEKNPKSATPLSSPAAIATNMEVSTADQPDANAVSHPPSILSLKDHSANISSSLTVPTGSLHVDSASMAHMEPDISCFAHYTKLHEPIRVKLADNHVVLAPGWGTMTLALQYEQSLTNQDFDFLHIPDLLYSKVSDPKDFGLSSCAVPLSRVLSLISEY